MRRQLNIGDKFGRLTVVGEGEYKKKIQYYKVQCECGSPVKEVSVYNLTSKTKPVKSCGCLAKENAKEYLMAAHRAARKHFGCMVCGSDKHYAKGLCHNCYSKYKRGTLYKDYMKKYEVDLW